MRCFQRVSVFVILGLLCACSGGGSTGTTIPQSEPNGTHPTSDAISVRLGLQPTTATLPVVSQITGTLLFPAVATPTTLELSASATAPSGVVLQSITRSQQSGTLTVYEYLTLVPAAAVTLPSIPAITLHFPASTPLAGKSVYYGISDLNAQGGFVSFNTQGPGTTSGQTVSFALVATPLTLLAGHRYTFVVYATGTSSKSAASKIYVGNFGNTITTYNPDGTQTTPTIVGGVSDMFDGIAVDAAGKIYVSNDGSTGNGATPAAVLTYNPDGSRATPTIPVGRSVAEGVAVDGAGKIYVVNIGNPVLTAFEPDGSPTTPTVTTQLPQSFLGGVAVDAAGRIYLSGIGTNPYGSLTIFNANGTPVTTIAQGLANPYGVAVDAAGKIYVTSADGGTVTTYKADGTQTTPTIQTGVYPVGVAVDATGKIYVLCDGPDLIGPPQGSAGPHTLTTYNADGSRTATPVLIVQPNASHVRGIAVH